jgi:hypothetical protein
MKEKETKNGKTEGKKEQRKGVRKRKTGKTWKKVRERNVTEKEE